MIKEFKKKLQDKIGLLWNRYWIDLLYYTNNSIWIISRQIGQFVIWWILLVLFTHTISPELYGNYQFILSIRWILSIFSLPGLKTSTTSSVIKWFEWNILLSVKKRLFYSMFWVIALMIVGIYFSYIQNNDLLWITFFFTSILFPVFYSYNIRDSYLIAKENFKRYSEFSLYSMVWINLLLIFAILFSPDSLFIITWVYLVTTSVIHFIFYKKIKKEVVSNEQLNKVSDKYMKYWMFLSKIQSISIAAWYIDKLILMKFTWATNLAFYAIWVDVAKKIQESIKSLFSIVAPRIVKYDTYKARIYIIVFITSIILALWIIIILPIIVQYLFWEEYYSSIIYAQIVIWFLPLYTINILLSNHYLLYIENKKILFWQSIIFPSTKVIVTILLYYFYWAYGLAVSVWLQNWLNVFILYLLNKIPFLNKDY
jgi:O-antigen/teichoic acid export membrane protein